MRTFALGVILLLAPVAARADWATESRQRSYGAGLRIGGVRLHWRESRSTYRSGYGYGAPSYGYGYPTGGYAYPYQYQSGGYAPAYQPSGGLPGLPFPYLNEWGDYDPSFGPPGYHDFLLSRYGNVPVNNNGVPYLYGGTWHASGDRPAYVWRGSAPGQGPNPPARASWESRDPQLPRDDRQFRRDARKTAPPESHDNRGDRQPEPPADSDDDGFRPPALR